MVLKLSPANSVKIRHFQRLGEVKICPAELSLKLLSGDPDWNVFEANGHIVRIQIIFLPLHLLGSLLNRLPVTVFGLSVILLVEPSILFMFFNKCFLMFLIVNLLVALILLVQFGDVVVLHRRELLMTYERSREFRPVDAIFLDVNVAVLPPRLLVLAIVLALIVAVMTFTGARP